MSPLSWFIGAYVAGIVSAVIPPDIWTTPSAPFSLSHGYPAATNARISSEKSAAKGVMKIDQAMSPYPRGEEMMDLPQLNKKATPENISSDTTNNITPEGYEFVFGPLNVATDANVVNKYMGLSKLQAYDINVCASECNKRAPDQEGGLCQFFNIYTITPTGMPDSYTCSMFYATTDESTALNDGGGAANITNSRGYRRISLVDDGGFEKYTCDNGKDFCHTDASATWKGMTSGSNTDASIFHYAPYAHKSNSSGLLGELNEQDDLPGSLAPANPLKTTRGKNYTIALFHWSGFNDPTVEENAFVNVSWNSQVVGKITPVSTSWSFYSFPVTAQGNDELKFVGGKAPVWSFIDDVFVFLSPS